MRIISTKRSVTALISMFALLGVGLVTATPSNAATPAPITDDTATPRGLWWPEVKAYVTCSNGWFSYKAAAWDLQSNQWYTTEFGITNGDGDGESGLGRQDLQASGQGFLTTSTFSGPSHGSGTYSATVFLIKGGQIVGQNTERCNM